MIRQLSLFVLLFFGALLGTALVLRVSRQARPGGATSDLALCQRHQIEDARCPWCHPELKEKLGFCQSHGVPEALCSRCQPGLIPGFKSEGDWCAEHSIPESQCLRCNPGLTVNPGKADAKPQEIAEESGRPRYLRSPTPGCSSDQMKIEFRSSDTEKHAGLECSPVLRRAIQERRSYHAELDFDRQSYALVSTPISGTLTKLHKQPGDSVLAGETVATLDSPEIGQAQSQLMRAGSLVQLAMKNLEREQGLIAQKISTERALFEAESQLQQSQIDLAEARQKLRSLGFTEDQLRQLEMSREPTSSKPISATVSGLIVERKASLGQYLDCGQTILAIVDPAQVWALAAVPPGELGELSLGQSCIFESLEEPRAQWPGRLTWISSSLDRHSRLAKIRAEIVNSSQSLRARTIGRLILPFQSKPSILVPKAAVQWEGCCNVVFLRRSAMLFEARRIKIGFKTEQHYSVESGLEEGDEVVTKGSYILKTELLKGSIGAGCCEEK